jgi:hypothetical protein
MASSRPEVFEKDTGSMGPGVAADEVEHTPMYLIDELGQAHVFGLDAGPHAGLSM